LPHAAYQIRSMAPCWPNVSASASTSFDVTAHGSRVILWANRNAWRSAGENAVQSPSASFAVCFFTSSAFMPATASSISLWPIQ
jgi:hypothetical protein